MTREAGIWRARGLFRQTWIGGTHDEARDVRVEVAVTFDGGPAQRRTYLVPPGGDWALNLDEFFPNGAQGVMANARIRVACDATCWADAAVYYAPIGQGAPTVTPMRFECQAP